MCTTCLFVPRSFAGGRHSPSASHGKYRIGQRLGVRAECGRGQKREKLPAKTKCETNVKINQIYVPAWWCQIVPGLPFSSDHAAHQRLSKLGHGVFHLPEIPGTAHNPQVSISIGRTARAVASAITWHTGTNKTWVGKQATRETCIMESDGMPAWWRPFRIRDTVGYPFLHLLFAFSGMVIEPVSCKFDSL